VPNTLNFRGYYKNQNRSTPSVEEVQADIAANGPYSYDGYNLTFTMLEYNKRNNIVLFDVEGESTETPHYNLPLEYTITETFYREE